MTSEVAEAAVGRHVQFGGGCCVAVGDAAVGGGRYAGTAFVGLEDDDEQETGP